TKVALMLIALLFCMVVHGFGSFKFIPMQVAIQDYFSINEGAYGIMTSAQNWMLIACSVPFGFLVRKLPCKISFIIGFAAAIGGMLIQIFTTSYIFFVIGRVVEGGGFGFIALITGSLILTLVAPNKRGLWSGLNMAASSAIPQIIITKGGSTLMISTGLSFKGVFYIICGTYALAAILLMILIPMSLRVHGISDSTKPTKEQTRRVFRNKTNWLVSLAFITFNAVAIGFTSYVIKFLVSKGMEQHQAANAYSYVTIIGLAAMILSGIISDKLGTKRKIIIVGFIAAAASMVLLAVLPANLIFIYIILYGTLPRSIAGLTNATAADIAEVPTDIPIVNSVKTTILQIGSVLNTILLGFLIQFLGYQTTIFILAGECLVGAILWFFAKKIP
ncbi:MAG: MFS transporter, partial [Lachnospiraceae bacterium]|nr:MFS transporter [Lachnospiraceae bacterium]